MGIHTPKCETCFDHVCKDVKLLLNSDWRIGSDGLYHWSRVVGEASVSGPGFRESTPCILSVCGVRVLRSAKG